MTDPGAPASGAAGPLAPHPSGGTPKPRSLVSIGDIAYMLYPVVPTTWLFTLARLNGRLRYHARRRDREVVRDNIRTVFGAAMEPQEIDQLTRRFFENQQLQNLLVTVAPRMSTAAIERVMPIDGLERLDRVLEAGRGAILLSSHVNSVTLWVLLMLLRRRGYDARVALPTTNDPWAQTRARLFVDKIAGRSPLRDHIGAFFAQFNIRPIVENLARNAAIGMTGDGWHSASFVDVELLGRTLPLTTGAMSISRSTGTPIVPIYMSGEPPLSIRAVIEEPFTVAKSTNPQQDVRDGVQSYACRLDRHIRSHVAGWQHLLCPDVLSAMKSWTQRPLADRYQI